MATTKWTADKIRELERGSIREFLTVNAGYFAGERVIDVGAGLSPYRDIVEGAGGQHIPFDDPEFPANVGGHHYVTPSGQFGVVLCTQVIQYVRHPAMFIDELKDWLLPNGVLVITYPTCWDEVEPEDMFRYTKAGMGRLLASRGLSVERNERRAGVELGGFTFWLGGGAVARKL